MPNSYAANPHREDDNVLAIHASALDLAARRLCGMQ